VVAVRLPSVSPEISVARLSSEPMNEAIFRASSAAIRGLDLVTETPPRFQGENFAANMNAVEIVRTIADAIGAKPSQVALAWLLGKGDFIVPIPGTKRRAYLEENAGAVDVKLSDDDMARLEAALRPEAVSGPRYNEKAMAWVDR